MSGEGLDSGLIMGRLQSLAIRTDRFDSVEGHEPPAPPGLGIRGAIWVEDIDTIPSGLNVVSVRLVLMLRVSRDLAVSTAEGLNRVDPEITRAVDAVYNALAVDYTLGGTCRNIDFHGEEGERCRARADYFEQDGKKYRVVGLQVPCLVDDVWIIGGS